MAEYSSRSAWSKRPSDRVRENTSSRVAFSQCPARTSKCPPPISLFAARARQVKSPGSRERVSPRSACCCTRDSAATVNKAHRRIQGENSVCLFFVPVLLCPRSFQQVCDALSPEPCCKLCQPLRGCSVS